jgi:Raf kinase inhibitor-like YbhB/YbcL family protein
MKKLILALLAAFVLIPATSCGPSAPPTPTATPTPPSPTPTPPTQGPASPTSQPFTLSSTAFRPSGEIPVQYTCHGANVSPPLQWSGVPQGAQGLALLAHDPDSVPPGFVHWVIYNIPTTARGLSQAVPSEATLSDGSLQGSNDFASFAAGTFPGGAPINQLGYDGPCPPARHSYVFTLYALDTSLDLPSGATRDQVMEAMEGHILAQAELTGVYTPPG